MADNADTVWCRCQAQCPVGRPSSSTLSIIGTRAPAACLQGHGRCCLLTRTMAFLVSKGCDQGCGYRFLASATASVWGRGLRLRGEPGSIQTYLPRSLVPALTLQAPGSPKSLGWCRWCVYTDWLYHCPFLRGLHIDLLCAVDTGRGTSY